MYGAQWLLPPVSFELLFTLHVLCNWKMHMFLTWIYKVLFFSLLSFYTQYNSINNATIFITPSLHNMFRPQAAIIRCLSYGKLFHCIECALYHITYNCNISWFKILYVIIDNLVKLVKMPCTVIYFKLKFIKKISLKFVKFLFTPLLGASSTCPNDIVWYPSLWIFIL
jgi:hypothetical protein